MTSASVETGDREDAVIGDSEHYINYVAPRFEAQSEGKAVPVKGSGKVRAPEQVATTGLEQAHEVDRKFTQGNPVTAKQLASVEAEALRTGKSPKQVKAERFKQEPSTLEAKLLTILVEFNDQANDDFTGSMVPATVTEDRTCVPGNVQNGPLHNNIPDPALASHADNNTMWVDDFSPEFFNRMLYTDEGITERVRPDLTGPDGQPGIDMSGFTMKSMYEEMSHGAYTVTGEATPWVEVGHSEGWYGATRCFQNDQGQWVAGAPQGMQGHPDNPGGAGTLATDAVAALAAAEPDFPWADYDLEDQADRDGDGNINEPDGVVDHLVLVHAGEDKSGGGGAEGVYSIWAHSSSVTGGATIPGTDFKISNYIVQPEDSGVGVFAHEYGHDLGLPDLYDTSGAADSDIDFWDLMASGSHSGPIFQSMPTHMGLWDKWVLGWADPEQVNPGDDTRTVKVGQNSRPQRGDEDGIIVNLPDKTIHLADPHSGTGMWWSGNDQDWADVKLSREVAVPAGTDLKFWMWNNYIIEADWDYGFVEVSTDGGATWTEQKVFDEAGTEVSTPDGYPDPNGRLADYGGKKYGLTGTSAGWRHDFVDLTPYAGTTIQVRLREATDAAFVERGWFADDFAVTNGTETVWSDDVESGNAGWTLTPGTFTDTSGEGWRIDSGTQVKAQFYLAEWRNFDGFDEGLKYAYDSTYQRDGSWKVQKVKYNAPGLLVSYRDTTFGDGMNAVNHPTANTTTLPSWGSKGGLLIVDSHFDPLRRTGEAATKDPSTLKNIPSRPQSSNATFGLGPTYPFTECLEAAGEPFSEYCTDFPAQAPVKQFTDRQGWYPGIEVRGSSLFFRDVDASVVVPSVGHQPYSTRIVDQDGNPQTDLYGLDIGGTILGSGNPDDDGVAYGTTITVKRAMRGNTGALVEVIPPRAE
ncbi:MAG: immune inhibitor A domain-containing protein [Nocardioidaceae bacterium]